jgi:hypothetical protein
MRRLLPAFLLLAVACASSAPKNPYRPNVLISQLNEMSFGATTRAPITVEVQIRNVAREPMTVRLIRLEGGLTQQYVVEPAERTVREAIAPGDTAAFRLGLTAVSQQGRILDPEPLNLRGFVTYDVAGQQYQDLYIFRVLMQ